MLEVKQWLETTGMKVAEVCFKKPPPYPYIVFIEKRDTSGADNKICIANRKISIELYSEKIDKECEKLIEDLLDEKSIENEKDRIWIESEKHFQTIYDFNLVEKMEMIICQQLEKK